MKTPSRSLFIDDPEFVQIEPLRTQAAEEFMEDLAAAVSFVRDEFSPTFSVSKHRSIYLTLYFRGSIIFTARFSNHVDRKISRRLDFSVVLEGGFQDDHENEKAIAALQAALEPWSERL